MAEFMRNSDAFTWAMETDPRLRSTIVAVLLLEGTPDWEVVRERFTVVSGQLPMLRQLVVPSPGNAPPRWEVAADFDLDYHLRRVGAPEPATLDGVLEMARLAGMESFDPARPMWQVTLIDGLADGQSAVLCKVHHALTDGVGGIQIGMALFDLSRNPAKRHLYAVPDPPESTPDLLSGYRDALRYNAELLGNVASGAVRAAPAALADTVRNPLGALKSAADVATSIYRTVRPVNRTGSSLMTQRSLTRQLLTLELPKDRLREAAHRCDGALNDAFVAGVAGGLRLYHEKHGSPVGDLHLTMPINLRRDSDPVGGNRVTLMRFDVPVGVVDPAERITAIRARSQGVRDERSLPLTQAIAGALNMMPRWYIGSILRNVDFVASNVPGIPIKVYLAGARLRMLYAFGPTIGAALNVTLVSYGDTCAVGINVDTAAVPDHELLRECLVAGFDEVLALAESTTATS